MQDESSLEAVAEAYTKTLGTQESPQTEAQSEQPVEQPAPESAEVQDDTDSELVDFELEDTTYSLPKNLAKHIESLKKGSLMEADYTKKTMALAEERKAIEKAAEERAKQLTAQMEQELNMYRSLADGSVKEPDPKLLEEDPIEYLKQLRKFEEWRNSTEERKAQTKAQRDAMVAEHNRKLLEANPHWSDPAAAAKDVGRIQEVLRSYSFSDPEIAEIIDYRAVSALKELADLREYKAKMEKQKSEIQKKVVNTPVKVEKPGAPSNNERGKEAMARLSKSGRFEDAVQAYLATRT